MSKLDTQNINVLNFNQNDVFVDSSKEHYKFSASRDGKAPSIVPMSLSELQYIASNTEIILTGWLTFDEDDKEEIFKLLRISNWKEILSNKEITEILKNPTLEGLQEIVGIESQTYFDRVRIMMYKLSNSGSDVSSKVTRIVDQRYNELRKRQRVSSILLSPKDTVTSLASKDDVDLLTLQNVKLQTQLDAMQKMLEQMMTTREISKTSSDNDGTNSDVEPVINNAEPANPKKVSKPRKPTL